MNLNIIIRYFEELEEEFKVFSSREYYDFMLNKSIDNPILRNFICSFLWYQDISGDSYSIKHMVFHTSQKYIARNETYDIEIIIEVLEKYYE